MSTAKRSIGVEAAIDPDKGGRKMDAQVNEAVVLQENTSSFRKSLLKKLAINSVDGMRFYDFLVDQTQLPVIGNPLRKLAASYYKHIHTNSVKLPLQDIEKVISQAEQVSIGPCSCRLIFDHHDCDAPLYTCMRINTFAEVASRIETPGNGKKNSRANKKSKVLSKKEAIDIMKNARAHGMVLSLESCISPYQNNICACCTCCCIDLKMRNMLGDDLGPAGPYVPAVDHQNCNACETCVTQCPTGAARLTGSGPVMDMEKCVRCGICAEICPQEAITMTIDKSAITKNASPGLFKLLWIMGFFYAFYLLYKPYLLFTRSQQYKFSAASPRQSEINVINW